VSDAPRPPLAPLSEFRRSAPTRRSIGQKSVFCEGVASMDLNLYMVSLVAGDLPRSVEFYRRLAPAIPETADGKSHVEMRMPGGLTFFLKRAGARGHRRRARCPPRVLPAGLRRGRGEVRRDDGPGLSRGARAPFRRSGSTWRCLPTRTTIRLSSPGTDTCEWGRRFGEGARLAPSHPCGPRSGAARDRSNGARSRGGGRVGDAGWHVPGKRQRRIGTRIETEGVCE